MGLWDGGRTTDEGATQQPEKPREKKERKIMVIIRRERAREQYFFRKFLTGRHDEANPLARE